MNGANVRPSASISTATGGEVFESASIQYNEGTGMLLLNFAWGSDNGYSDLVSTFLSAHIHGPASSDEVGGLLYNITPLVNNSSVNFADAGVFIKEIALTENPNNSGYTVPDQIGQLLSGKWYIDVHTSFLPEGEIRGQLVPVPEPQTYGLIGGAGLAAFALVRRWRK